MGQRRGSRCARPRGGPVTCGGSNRETPLVPCRSLPKGCASQDGQPSKSGACAAHPSAPCATKLEASSSRAGRCSREQSCRLCLAGRGEDVRACGVVTRVIKADRSPAVTHSNLWVSLASRNEHFHYISLYPDNAPSFVLSFVLIPVRVRAPATPDRQTDRQLRPSVVPAPSAQRYSSGCSSGHMVVTARQPRRPSRKGGESDTHRPATRSAASDANTRRHSHLPSYGWTAGPQVPLPPERQCP